MAINVNFNSAVLYKPGSYSRTIIDLGGNFPLGVTGVAGIIGESGSGPVGLLGPFSPDQMDQIRSLYGSGNIVDAARFLFAPAADAAIPNGANSLYIYKTNASQQAYLALSNTDGTVTSLEYGVGGNLITFRNTITAETAPTTAGVSTPWLAASAAFATDTFKVHVNGGTTLTFTAPDWAGTPPVNKAAFLADLNDTANWSSDPALSNITITDTDVLPANVTLNVTMTPVLSGPTDVTHRLGYGRSFELRDGTGTVATLGLTAGLNVAAAEPKDNITVVQTRDGITYGPTTVGGSIVMTVGYYDATLAATAATVTIDQYNVVLTVTGGPDAGTRTLVKSQYPTMTDLVNAIGANNGWTAAIGVGFNNLSPSLMDRVSTAGAQSHAAGLMPFRAKADASSVKSTIDLCPFAFLAPSTGSYTGLIDAVNPAVYLANGSLNKTVDADIANGFTAMTKMRVNAIIPLFSRDATADIADGLTDSQSTYTIAAVHSGLKNHLSFTATTKARSERQGYASIKDTYANSKLAVSNMGYGRVQMVIQDVKQVDSTGVIRWFQPWALACMIAGSRCGSPVGTPLTFKYMNATGIRQTAQPMTTPDASIVQDFDADIMYDDAIQNGVTFLEHPQTGGFRVVVDNTTYGKDGNWVLNRGNVLYAADVVAYDFRNQLEQAYVGAKNTITNGEVASFTQGLLATYLTQGITVAPGYKNLSVRITGNTINISVVVVLVEGIDFILTDLTITRAGT